MKKTMCAFVFTLAMLIGWGQAIQAQTNNEEVDLFQSIFGMQKKAVVSEFLGIENDDQFWSLYDQYETERKELGKKRIDLLVDYTQQYNSLNETKYDELIEQTISLRKSTDKLLDSYYKKIRKTSGSKLAAQFFQLESFFSSQIRASILEEIPYIGEFDQ